MLARVVLRELTLRAILAANTLAQEHVFVRDWPTNAELNPIAVLINLEKDHKISNAKTVPNFTSTPAIILDIRVQEKSLQDAKIKMEQLLTQIEQAVFTNYALNEVIQQFAYVISESSYNSDSEYHIGSSTMTIGMEIFELFQINPETLDNIKQVNVNVDLINRFDSTGTYINAEFPESVTPAPRTQGPDGRPEGQILIDNLDA